MGGDMGDFAFWLAVGFLFLGLTFGPIGKAFARLIEALAARLSGSGFGASAGALESALRRVEELEGVEHRLLEVEERLDFAERLLTSGPRNEPGEVDTPPEPAAAVR
jgi:hypothetical protein